MIDAARAGAARCFYVTVHLVSRRTNGCQELVAWIGVIRTADGVAHRVLACDAHVEQLEGGRPFPTCIDAAESADDVATTTAR